MGKLGLLDTDTTALAARINAHSAYGSGNLEEWVFSHLDLKSGLQILELGCGTGKQTIPLARAIGEEGQITAVDIAETSLSVLKDSATEEGLLDRIRLINCGLDETQSYLSEDGSFDRAVACYSIYYANEPREVFKSIHQSLAEGGSFFFCGPASTNNAELKAFHSRLSGRNAKLGAAPFMEDEGQNLASEIFSTVQVWQFDNALNFDSVRSLHDYWKSYNLYDPDLEPAFLTAADEHFSNEDRFTTFKRVLGVSARK